MRSVLVGTLVGVCGSILFEALNRSAGWLVASTPHKWLVLGGIFVVFFLAAVMVDKQAARKQTRKSIGSGNSTDATQSVEIADVVVRADSDTVIGSDNRAKGEQKIIISGKVDV